MRLLPLLLAVPLVACGDSEPTTNTATPTEEAVVEDVEIVGGADVTAIDAATDNDAGLADPDVPGRNEVEEDEAEAE